MFNRSASPNPTSPIVNHRSNTPSSNTPLARFKQRLKAGYLRLGKTDLQRMLVISATVHAAVLIVRFVPEEFAKRWDKESLQVVLVNAASDQLPSDAQALSNANLRGGGEADEGMVKSPLPNLEAVQDGESLEDLQKQVKNLEAVQSSLLSALKGKATNSAISGTSQQYNPDQGQAADVKDVQLKREVAALDKEIQDYNKRPKRAQVSPATREAAFATYYALWSAHTERLGTDNYPLVARGKYAEVVVTVSVRADGSLEGMTLERTSGDSKIDSAAILLLKRLAPYPRFKGSLKAGFDVLDITTKLVFTPANTLTAETRTDANFPTPAVAPPVLKP
jgi:periplasmic protein TonB